MINITFMEYSQFFEGLQENQTLLILLLELHTAAEEAPVTQISSIHSCSPAVCRSTLLTLLETPLPSATQKPPRSQF